MSTRRARIKAVASLPVRRKNAEAKDAKTKAIAEEATEEKQEVVSDQVQTAENVPSIIEINAPKSPVIAEKQSAITSTSLYKNILNSSVNNPSPNRLKIVCKVTPSPQLSNNAKSLRNRCESDSDTDTIVQKISRQSPKPVHKGSPKASTILGITKIANPIPKPIDTDDDDNVLDGIVPLQKAPKPKPLDLLKNEIISENAEVVFDPIIPLPSPSKVRAKLRPVPRLAPLRRNSIQGSASETEDDIRRVNLPTPTTPGPSRQRNDSQSSISTLHSLPHREINRVRNDSICSAISQTQGVPPSPHKEKHLLSKSKRLDSRRLSILRRREKAKGATKECLTMYDLIFYNPITNPLIPDKEEEETRLLEKSEEIIVGSTGADDEKPDDPPEEEDCTPAPQIKIGPDGKIILDEKSLVIEETEGKRKLSKHIVREGSWSSKGGKYSRAPRSADWSGPETIRFYRALAAVGTDFSMMAPLFPMRTRRELKIKFKKEERNNGMQVDKALISSVPWDILSLEQEFKKQRAEEVIKKENAKQEFLKLKQKTSKIRSLRNSGAKISHGNAAVDIYPERKRLENDTPTLDDILGKTNPKNAQKTYSQIKTLSKPNPSLLPRVPIPDLNPIKINTANKSTMPANIENGSLVLLTVDDPNFPTKKILQTYITDSNGLLTAVNLPPGLLSSVTGYLKKGTPNTPSPSKSPAVRNATPNPINPSPSKRIRHDSYTIKPL